MSDNVVPLRLPRDRNARKSSLEREAILLDKKRRKLIKEKGQRSLSKQERLQFARNLGQLLNLVKQKRGLLAKVLVHAQVSPNRISRFVESPNDSLSPDVTTYFDLAKAVAAFSVETETPITEADAIVRLCSGTVLQSDAVDGAEFPDLEDLCEMMIAAGDSIIQRHDLQRYYSDISRKGIWKDLATGLLGINDHPAKQTLEGDGPEGFFDEDERIGLIPMVPLYELPLPASEATAILEYRPADQNVAREAVRLSVTYSRVIYWALMPTDGTNVVVPAFFERAEPSAKIAEGIDFHTHTLLSPSIVRDILHRHLARESLDTSGVPDEVPVTYPGGFHARVVSIPAELRSLLSDHRVGQPTFQRVSLRSIHRFLVEMHEHLRTDEVVGRIGMNYSLTFSFEGPARAPSGTIAAYLERHFRYAPPQMNRLDAMLDQIAGEMAAALREYIKNIDTVLRAGRDHFVAAWSRANE